MLGVAYTSSDGVKLLHLGVNQGCVTYVKIMYWDEGCILMRHIRTVFYVTILQWGANHVWS